MTGESFYESELYTELCELTYELERWYYIDHCNIKWYAVYVCARDEPRNNLFDIWEDGINVYDNDHVIPNEAMKIIHKIQEKLREIDISLEAD